MELLGGFMKNQDSTNVTSSMFARVRLIIGTLMAIAGVGIFTVATMFNLIEPTTVIILSSLVLFVSGLLLANSIKVIEFIQDIMLR